MFEKIIRKFREWRTGCEYLEGDMLVEQETGKIWMVVGKTYFVENHLWVTNLGTGTLEWVSIRNVNKGVMTRLSSVGKALNDL